MQSSGGGWMLYCVQRKCRITEYKYFDTHWKREDGDKLANYLNAVPFDSHVMVLTHGEAFGNMSKKAFDVLCALGVDIADVAEKGMTFAALIVRGSHCRTMYELHQDDLAQLKLQLNGIYQHHHHHHHHQQQRQQAGTQTAQYT